MTASYIHTRRKLGPLQWVLRALGLLYFIGIAVVVAYVWLFAQNRYITVSSFKISREDGSIMSGGLAQLISPTMSDTGSSDSQTAIGYINSADLLTDLEKQYKLRAHYSAPQKDFVFRLEPDAPLEDRLKFYRKRIYAHYDTDTGLTMLTVDTFEPELSRTLAAELLKKAEMFINKINQSVADQQLGFVRSELERTAKHVEEIHKELIIFQNQHNLINPEEQIKANLSAVQELRMTRLRTEASLTSLMRDSPDAPQIDSIRSQLKSLDELIEVENAKLSGPDQNRLNQLLVKFEELKQKLEFATRLRTGAEALLEKNRVDASSQTRFFTVIQNPYLPEDVGLPRRPYATATIIILGILGFLVLRALTRSIFERA